MAEPVSTMAPTMGTRAITVIPVAQEVQRDGAGAPPIGMTDRVISADIAAAPLPGAAVLAAQRDGEVARPLGVEAPALTTGRMDARARGGGDGIFRAGYLVELSDVVSPMRDGGALRAALTFSGKATAQVSCDLRAP